MTKKKESFESIVAEVDKLVQHLESGDPGLEEALSTYEKGVTAIAVAQKQLVDAEQRVQELLRVNPDETEATDA